MVHINDDCSIRNIIDQYGDMVYRICLVYLKNKTNAEDAFQDVFIKIIEKAPNFVSEEHQKAWIITVTSNHCKNLLKKDKRNITLLFDENILSNNTTNDEQELLPIILNLPLDYRNVLYLYYYEGYSTKEISKLLNKKDATIRTWLKRARESLKIELGGVFYE